jgi:hypothetical protein
MKFVWSLATDAEFSQHSSPLGAIECPSPHRLLYGLTSQFTVHSGTWSLPWMIESVAIVKEEGRANLTDVT